MIRHSANGLRAGGCAGFGGCCVHGDLGSDKSANQASTVENHQVTQQGQANIGLSNSALSNSQISIIDGDVETAKAAIGLANNTVGFSHAVQSQVLSAFDAQQERMISTVKEAVQAAQDVAYRSTSVPQSALSENVTKQVLTAAVIGLGIVTIAIVTKKK